GPEGSAQGADGEPLTPVAAGVGSVNGATAIGARSRFADRRRADSRR
ncbi:undecaprenyl/decaprenyl-phosphate alpha-N-acetylglucosaminyl 1-phosphate transferase, partial [Streptomyces sp. T-3]|nr:undecaprenyl/decaprenyl-phosphate alpha-N-acetylglucosaminyl 1-phosphate transferase [Streptomyces sp. T-3]